MNGLNVCVQENMPTHTSVVVLGGGRYSGSHMRTQGEGATGEPESHLSHWLYYTVNLEFSLQHFRKWMTDCALWAARPVMAITADHTACGSPPTYLSYAHPNLNIYF